MYVHVPVWMDDVTRASQRIGVRVARPFVVRRSKVGYSSTCTGKLIMGPKESEHNRDGDEKRTYKTTTRVRTYVRTDSIHTCTVKPVTAAYYLLVHQKTA